MRNKYAVERLISALSWLIELDNKLGQNPLSFDGQDWAVIKDARWAVWGALLDISDIGCDAIDELLAREKSDE